MAADDIPGAGSDRRRVIKHAAIAGGLVWSAPSVRRFTSFVAAGTTPPESTTMVTVPEETTTTTQPEPCDCTFCGSITAGSLTLYFVCAPTTPDGCDCLCACGGVNRPCSQSDPCTVEITCTPTPGNQPCS